MDWRPPTKEEIKIAPKQLRNGKSAGPDNIPAEALKADFDNSANTLHPLFSKNMGGRETRQKQSQKDGKKDI